MTLEVDIARAAAGANVVLLAALIRVWAGSYRQIRSTQTLGTLLFALLLLAENLLALFYYVTAVSLPVAAFRSMMYLQLLETAALAFLTYVTYQ